MDDVTQYLVALYDLAEGEDGRGTNQWLERGREIGPTEARARTAALSLDQRGSAEFAEGLGDSGITITHDGVIAVQRFRAQGGGRR